MWFQIRWIYSIIKSNLFNLIIEYFKAKYHDGTGGFAPDTKQKVCEDIFNYIKLLNIKLDNKSFTCTILPGLISLYEYSNPLKEKINFVTYFTAKVDNNKICIYAKCFSSKSINNYDTYKKYLEYRKNKKPILILDIIKDKNGK